MPESTIHEGDALTVLQGLPAESIHAVVTDPPYGLAFMGKKWDYDLPQVEVWQECLRVLKPGGHLLAFGGARTYHRLVCGIEDAGFEIRDQLMWIHGGGMPKSHNLKGDWEGWGTTLKPSHEPIVMARKNFRGTTAESVATTGCGALNVNACRVHADDAPAGRKRHGGGVAFAEGASGFKQDAITTSPAGRWPANIIHDGGKEVLDIFTEQGGGAVGAPRFFYAAKPTLTETGSNCHPTVKPLALMRWLVRLVCPPSGVVLDCFMGSGTTGVACKREGFGFIGIEKEPEYVQIARQRINAVDLGLFAEEA